MPEKKGRPAKNGPRKKNNKPYLSRNRQRATGADDTPFPRARVLLVDLEISPTTALVWQKWRAKTLAVVRDARILCMAWKWMGERQVHVKALPDYKTYKRHPDSDRELVQELWSIFDQADVICSHNTAFDCRRARAAFARCCMPPPSPAREFCSLRAARRVFGFFDNSLAGLAEHLQLPQRKMDNEGIGLWVKCMAGDLRAFKKLKAYNAQDVRTLAALLERLRPYVSNWPDLTWHSREWACPSCEGRRFTARGWQYSKRGRRRRCVCESCGRWFTVGRVQPL